MNTTQYNNTIKHLESQLTLHPSGDITYHQFTLPKGLQWKQYVGIVAMLECLRHQHVVEASRAYEQKMSGTDPVSVHTRVAPGLELVGLDELANKLMSETSVVGQGLGPVGFTTKGAE